MPDTQVQVGDQVVAFPDSMTQEQIAHAIKSNPTLMKLSGRVQDNVIDLSPAGQRKILQRAAVSETKQKPTRRTLQQAREEARQHPQAEPGLFDRLYMAAHHGEPSFFQQHPEARNMITGVATAIGRPGAVEKYMQGKGVGPAAVRFAAGMTDVENAPLTVPLAVGGPEISAAGGIGFGLQSLPDVARRAHDDPSGALFEGALASLGLFGGLTHFAGNARLARASSELSAQEAAGHEANVIAARAKEDTGMFPKEYAEELTRQAEAKQSAEKLAYEKRALKRIGASGRQATKQANEKVFQERMAQVTTPADRPPTVPGEPASAQPISVPEPNLEDWLQAQGLNINGEPVHPQQPLGTSESEAAQAIQHEPEFQGPVPIDFDRFTIVPKEGADAVRERGAAPVLQREPRQAGEAGGQRGRVEPGEQGQEVAGAQPQGGVQTPQGGTRRLEGPTASDTPAPTGRLVGTRIEGPGKEGRFIVQAGGLLSDGQPTYTILDTLTGKTRKAGTTQATIDMAVKGAIAGEKPAAASAVSAEVADLDRAQAHPLYQAADAAFSASKRPSVSQVRAHLSKLEKAGFDMWDAEDALGEYSGLERGDFEDAEEFQEARNEAWQNFQETFRDSTSLPSEEELAEAQKPILNLRSKKRQAGVILAPQQLATAMQAMREHTTEDMTFEQFRDKVGEVLGPASKTFSKQIWNGLRQARRVTPPAVSDTQQEQRQQSNVDPASAEGQLLAKLREAKRKAPAVKAGYAPQRGKRFAAFRREQAAAPNTEAGFKASKAPLHGELTQPPFEPLDLPQEHRDALFTRVKNSNLGATTRLDAGDGLDKILDREHPRIPNPTEVKALRKVFGDDYVDDMTGAVAQHWWRRVADILQIPRSIMETGNLHATLRQALTLSVANPKAGARALAAGMHAMVDRGFASRVDAEIRQGPNMPVYDEAGLHLTGRRLSEREEDFQSELAERIPLIGPLVGASRRSYSTQLNVLRTAVFDNARRAFEQSGVTPETHPEVYHNLAQYINKATGWGEFGKADDLAPYLNTVFYSPRLQASRIQLMMDAATGFKRYTPEVRQLAVRDFAANAGFYGSMLTLAVMSGAKVTLSPESPDFGKIVYGNTHIDISGGFGSLYRPFLRAASAMEEGFRTGKKYKRSAAPSDIVQNAAYSKLAPIPGFIHDIAQGRDMEGRNMVGAKNVGKAAVVRFDPIFVHEVLQEMAQQKEPAGAVIGGLSFFGAGTNTYQQKGTPAVTSEQR